MVNGNVKQVIENVYLCIRFSPMQTFRDLVYLACVCVCCSFFFCINKILVRLCRKVNDELLQNINGQLIGFDIYLVLFVFVMT